jgi:hypothetical protein
MSSLVETLVAMRGVWRDVVRVFDLDGRALPEDKDSGTPGESPWENLVYVDFDGERYLQTNVVLRGRAPGSRTFSGRIERGILFFDLLGPEDPQHIGVSGGPGTIVFAPWKVTPAWTRYVEPDVIRVQGEQRARTTVLYRGGVAIRTLSARGERLAHETNKRHPLDPRTGDGPVHGDVKPTPVFAGGGA